MIINKDSKKIRKSLINAKGCTFKKTSCFVSLLSHHSTDFITVLEFGGPGIILSPAFSMKYTATSFLQNWRKQNEKGRPGAAKYREITDCREQRVEITAASGRDRKRQRERKRDNL